MTNTNVYEVELPSSGSTIPDYPKKLTVSTLTVQAFKLYAGINDTNILSVLKDIVKICVQDKNFDVGKLKFQDFMFLVMWLRINSSIPGCDSNYEYQVTCTCRDDKDTPREFTRKVSLSDIPITPLVGYIEPSLVKLYSDPTQTLGLKILALDDEIEIFNLTKANDPLIQSNLQTIRSAYSITSPIPVLDRVKYIDSFTDIRDLASILDFTNKYAEWGFSFRDKDVVCPYCKKSETMVIPLQTDIFVPTLLADGYFEKSRVN